MQNEKRTPPVYRQDLRARRFANFIRSRENGIQYGAPQIRVTVT